MKYSKKRSTKKRFKSAYKKIPRAKAFRPKFTGAIKRASFKKFKR